MNLISILQVALRMTGPILLVAMGCIFAMRANIFNLGLEGFMLAASFAAVWGAYITNNCWLGVLFAIIVAVIYIAIYAVFILELKADPVICAIAVITLASGMTRFLCKPVFGSSGRFSLPSSLAIPTYNLPWLSKIPFIGPILNNQSVLILLAIIAPFVIQFIIYRTRFGLKLRAVGLNEEAAQAAGINVKRVKYTALLINGVFCGLGGALLALSVYMFNIDMTDGRGYMALASCVLANGQPLLVLLATLMFGFAESIQVSLSKYEISSYLLEMIPYAMAILAAVLPYVVRNIRGRIRQKRSQIDRISAYYKNQNEQL